MKNSSLVICDKDEAYAKALSLYLTGKKEFLSEIQVRTELKALQEEKEEIDVLLISEEYPGNLRKNCKANKTFLLYSGKKPAIQENEVLLFKYQSGEKILTQIVEECGELFSEDVIFRTSSEKEEVEILGVFSPVHRIGKTSYALELGEEYAQHKNVLYLNLELYSGMQGHFEDRGQALADVLYHARQEKQNLGLFLSTHVQHLGNVDVVAGMFSEDMKQIHAKEWKELLQKIVSQTIYDVVILDIDEGIPEVYDLLQICTKIYILVKEDLYGQAKMRQLEKEICLLRKEEILTKITRISVE